MKMRISHLKWLNLLVLMMLTGCSFFSPVKVQPENTYMITEQPNVVAKGRRTGATLLVMVPETAPAYDTTAMAFTKQRYQVAYYGLNKWAETPGQMLHPLIIHTMRK